jgi:hypothetical protein
MANTKSSAASWVYGARRIKTFAGSAYSNAPDRKTTDTICTNSNLMRVGCVTLKSLVSDRVTAVNHTCGHHGRPCSSSGCRDNCHFLDMWSQLLSSMRFKAVITRDTAEPGHGLSPAGNPAAKRQIEHAGHM